MRTLSFNSSKGGLNRQRVRGGVKAETLYDALNTYQTGARTWVQRDGTVRDAVLAANTRGLTAFKGILHTFSNKLEDYTPVGYQANVLAHPTDDEATLTEIHFAQPFMGALYVVAEWSDGGIYHYWLASSGEWTAETVYLDGTVVTPTVPNGLLYKAVANNPDAPTQTWQPLKNYAVGDKVLPTTYNGYYFEVTATQGDVPISGAVEPSWNANEGAETVESLDSTGAPASSASEESAPQVPPDVRDRYGTGQTEISAASAAAVGLSDSVPAWQPGTLYAPGSLVKPLSVAPVINSAIPNAGFEDGDNGWTKGTGWHIVNTGNNTNGNKPYQGSWFAKWVESEGKTPFPDPEEWRYLEMGTTVPVVPGQFLSASCYDSRKGGNDSGMDGQLVLIWYDQYDAVVKITGGTSSGATKAKDYRIFTVQDSTPGGATKVKVAYRAKGRNNGGQCAIDNFEWDYVNLTPVEADFTVYQATQAAAGMSGTSEPAWPGAGNSVVDNEVTWLGGVTSVITWTARPIMKSGSSEPTWGEQPGSTSPDGTISWLATTGYVEQAPNSKIVALAAKKVFAGDDDIAPYSATVNPLDWTTPEDAGYLPTGLNTHGANPVAAMGLFRGNLMIFNSAGFQMWQVDPDPELMSLLDAIPIGSTYHKALQPVKNDLVFLTQLGYRSVGIAGASTNLEAGDLGDPIDPLVQAKLEAGEYEPKSIFYPARGQYWSWFGEEVFVCTFNDFGPSWSRYVFPEAITDATLLDNDLYLRTATHKVWKVDAATLVDDLTQQTHAAPVLVQGGIPAAVFTAMAHGLANGTPITLTAGVDPVGGPFSPGVTYYVVNATGDTFNVALTEGGEGIEWNSESSFQCTLNWAEEPTGEPFDGTLWWPSLDAGSMGVMKQLDSFDLVCQGEVAVQFGYDQRDPSVLTDDYVLYGDTLPGTSIPFPLSAPSFAPKLVFSGGQAWEWMALNLYLQDSRSSGFAG